MNDCISRASLIEHLDNVCYNPDTPWGIAQKAYINCFKAFINREPSVTQTERTGHWEDCSNGWMCSECKSDNTYDTNYCPNCGAKMIGEQE